MIRRIIVVLTIFLLSVSLKADTLQRLSAIATGGIPWDNETVGIYDYLTDRGAVSIIDVSDSTLPQLSFRSTNIPWGAEGINIQDTIIYINDVAIMWIGRLTQPDTIVFLSWYDIPNPALSPEPWGIEVRDTILYVAVGDEGLYIFNVSDPTNPTQITFYDTPYNLTEFFILDSLIYLADCDSMIILNISNPTTPQYVGAVDMPTTCTDVHVVYPYAYATAYASFGVGTDGSIKIIDISDPTNPTIVGSINNIRGDPRAVFVNDDYIYCAAMDWWAVKENKGKTRADVEGGIRVAQGVTPDSLIISYDTPGDPREIFVRGNLLLVPDYDSLQILHHNKTGIEEHDNKAIPLISKFLVYPNPARNVVTCEMEFVKSCRISLNVYDQTGRKVKGIYDGSIVAGRTIFSWDGKDENGRNVANGTYFVKARVLEPVFQESEKVIFLGGE